ncbi:hypothetical protein HDV01_000643 [Terramyces sp. JEL0728]|nr:hypothetical protein HDV01_000643 [Terramyces sp. JEL0728]
MTGLFFQNISMIFNSSFPPIRYQFKDTFSTVFFDGKLPDDRINRPALIDGITNETYTYGQLLTKITSLAAYLHSIGVKRGDVIAIYAPNHIQYPVVLYAAIRLGAVVTTANPNYLASEFAYQLQDSGAKYIFSHDSVLANALEAGSQSKIPKSRVFVFGLKKIDSHLSIDELAALGSTKVGSLPTVKFTERQLKEDTAYLCYSSGTTGRSKGVMTTHDNLVSNVHQLTAFEKMDGNDVTIGVLPFYHIYALNIFLHFAIWRGTTIVVQSKFDLPAFLGMIQTYKVTILFIVPPIAIGMAKHPIVSKFNLSTVKFAMSGAAPLGNEVSAEFTKRLGIPIKQGYGMTETSPLTHSNPMEKIVPGSIGILAPSVQAKLIDPDGKELGYDQEGELCLRGANIMKGYLNNQKATKETIINGWLHTGDVARVNKDGYFFIVDRIKELIKYKGLQVVPAELESYLLGHPAIADAAVIPRPDAAAGEIPKAYVVLKPGAKATELEIQQYIESKTSYHKWLRGGVEFINEIPKSAAGKILRRILRDMDKKNLAKL